MSGIWQTVWLEGVPKAHIASLTILPNVDKGSVAVTVRVVGGGSVKVTVRDGDRSVAKIGGDANQALVLTLPDAKLWSPDTPFLYELDVSLASGDAVKSYFAMRKISVAPDAEGVPRIQLNNVTLFQFGAVDQGRWPDGLYTAPSDEALVYDLKTLKQLGMNMLRKSGKIEPARFYAHCDAIGLLVWQDMPGGDIGAGEGSRKQFRSELQRTVEFLRNAPCVVMWVPFNEGWGQHDTAAITQWIKQLDPTRLVNEASGWDNEGSGDIRDVHVYALESMPRLDPRRATVLGECGALGREVPEHLWHSRQYWGSGILQGKDDYLHYYDTLIHALKRMEGEGLSAAVYYQATDVETELNGLLTYDREVLKVDPERVALMHACLYDAKKTLPPVTPLLSWDAGKATVLVPTSEGEGRMWRYTTDAPGEGWTRPDFDDSAWKTGPGMFGRGNPHAKHVRTEWGSGDIYLRKTFTLEDIPKMIATRIFHDDDARIFINDTLINTFAGYSRSYVDKPVEGRADFLKKGQNTIAVHCHQGSGGQVIDLGILCIME